jgi:tetratricopeptide (TPR) repeat protein
MMAGFWLPVSNLFWPISYFAADRYMYAVSAGFILIVIWAGERLLGNFPKVLRGSLPAVCVILAVLAWRQDRTWATEQALYLRALAVSPTSTTALLGLGVTYLNQGRLPEAQTLLERGAMNFNDSKALYLLAITYERQGNQSGAISYYRRFVQMNEPRYAQEVANARRQLLRYGVAM